MEERYKGNPEERESRGNIDLFRGERERSSWECESEGEMLAVCCSTDMQHIHTNTPIHTQTHPHTHTNTPTHKHTPTQRNSSSEPRDTSEREDGLLSPETLLFLEV